MAFQKIDDSATSEKRPLDTVILNDIEESLREAQANRLRFGGWGATYTDLPRLCCGPHKGVIPFVWYLDPGVTELTISIRHKPVAQTVQGFTIGVSVASLEQAMRYVPGTAAAETRVGSATTGTTDTTFTITSAMLSGIASGWMVVFLEFLSDRGARVEINDGTTKRVEQVVSWRRAFIALKPGNSAYNTAEVPCSMIDLLDDATDESLYPGGFQVLRTEDATLHRRVYVYPFFPESSEQTIGSAEWTGGVYYAALIPLGYTDLVSVDIEATAITPFDDAGASHDAGRGARAPIPAALYLQAEKIWREQTAVHHMGPQTDARDTESDFPDEAIDKVGNRVELLSSFTNATEVPVSYDGKYKPYIGADEHYRTLYQAVVICMLQHFETDNRSERSWALDMRLSCIDDDRTGGEHNGATVQLGDGAESAFHSFGNRGFVQTPEAPFNEVMTAYLAGFTVVGSGNHTNEYTNLRRHSLRGVWPVAVWNLGHFNAVPLSIVDNEASLNRYARVQVKSAFENSDGDMLDAEGVEHAFPVNFHVATWTLITSPVNVADNEIMGIS